MLEKWLSRLLGLFGEPLPDLAMERTSEAQQRMDERTAGLSLYHFDTCPYCVMARNAIDRLGLKVQLRDIRKEKTFGEELAAQGGKGQVPCLRIDAPEGTSQWLYESTDIIRYLKKEFGGG